MQTLIEKGCIPLDKSWIIRMGILDAINDKNDIFDFLKQQKELGDDLKALLRALETWKTNEAVDVGESGTLYRFLKFASWKLGLNKEFVLRGTLKVRSITDDPEIINYSLGDLLKLDNETSQWASASVLLGNKEVVENPPYKLKVTYEAVEHWNKQRGKGECWMPRYDETILNQALAYLELLKGETPDFKPAQAEDYCFARAFGYMTKEEGEKRWPSLLGHESNRIEEMEKVLVQTEAGEEITSKDHRVIQSIAMKNATDPTWTPSVQVKYPESVNKSWPEFWEFLIDSRP